MKKYIIPYNKFFEATEDEQEQNNIIADNDLSKEFEETSISDFEKSIKEYNLKRIPLYNIYMQYKDREELKSKLISAKFAEKDGDSLRFINPLLKSYAKICDLYRKIKDCEDYVKSLMDERNIKEQAVKDNTNLSDGMAEQINNINSLIDEYNDKINNYKGEISQLSDKLDEKVNNVKKQIEQSKKDINQ